MLSVIWPHSFISGHIDRVGLLPVPYWVEKSDDMGLAIREYLRQRDVELLIRWVVGPQGKDSAGQEVRRKLAQTNGLVERCVARIQQVSRGMVHVQKYGVKFPAVILGI